jgi:hypothetical protein
MDPQGEGSPQTFGDVIRDILEHRLADVHTCLPGIIQTIYPGGFADVLPLIKREEYGSDETTSLPILTHVRVIDISTKTCWIHIPVDVGDNVLLFFSERSIDNFMASGGLLPVEPEDSRKHDLSDSFCIPAQLTISSVLPLLPGEESSLVIGTPLSKFVMQPTGKFRIEKSPNELFAALISITTQLSNLQLTLQSAITSTFLGPQPLDPLTQASLVAHKAAIDAELAKLVDMAGV